MGLQYMYGPNYTWEGFQLMGFQASIMRSGGQGRVPIIAWITPSDGTNITLKSSSALAQGAKHFFYWSYGPTSLCTENYWSDLRGAYDGLVRITRQLAKAEHIIAPGQTRPTRVALFYSLSSDLWQPFGYLQMLERRLTYLSLIHDQYLVDLLTEQDVEAGRLTDYDVLYVTDPNITDAAAGKIRTWVKRGGWLYASTAAGSRNEFNEETRGLADVFGIKPSIKTTVQPGRYHIRGALNGLADLDRVALAGEAPSGFGVIGLQVEFRPTTAKVVGRFADGTPAVVRNRYGRGTVLYVGGCPGLAYGKAAKFVPRELKEKWPASVRAFLNSVVRESGAARLVTLSHPVVEAGVYDAPAGTALVLGNFAYEPIPELKVELPLRRRPKRVAGAEAGELKFELWETPGGGAYPFTIRFTVPLGLNEMVVVE
ncbi:beta-galactosidase trimerization domain-containing protein [bacterium]|nr:beta-galactosidase trimerization domain-containing protein [bacterium]